eukprot:9476968-Pyramimonas_sp.AAC.1
MTRVNICIATWTLDIGLWSRENINHGPGMTDNLLDLRQGQTSQQVARPIVHQYIALTCLCHAVSMSAMPEVVNSRAAAASDVPLVAVTVFTTNIAERTEDIRVQDAQIVAGIDEDVEGKASFTGVSFTDTGGDADPLQLLGTGISGWLWRRVFYLQIITGCRLGCSLPESLQKLITPATVGCYTPPMMTDFMTEFASLMAATLTETFTMYIAALSIEETTDRNLPAWQTILVLSLPLVTVGLLAVLFSEMTSRRYLFYRCLEELTLMDLNNEK